MLEYLVIRHSRQESYHGKELEDAREAIGMKNSLHS